MVSKRFASHLIVLLLGLAPLSACDSDGNFDQAATESFFKNLEGLEGLAQGENGQPTDPNQGSSIVGPADTRSTARPPLPKGGETLESAHTDNGWNAERIEYGPLEADYDEVLKDVKKHYGDADLSITETNTAGLRYAYIVATATYGHDNELSFIGQTVITEESQGVTVHTQYQSEDAEAISPGSGS
jgi:hypothetical protein